MDQIPNGAEYFVPVNTLNLHYVDYGGDGPILVLLHGLTANARAFEGLMEAGLGNSYRVICPDLRGNGLSDKPAFRYSMEDHAMDIIGLIKKLGERKVYLGGHSFGGYVAFYIAANYPEYVAKLVILDAAKAMNPNAAEMLSKAISRLNVTYKGFPDYVEHVKKAPYLDFWDPAMLPYYRADVQDMPDGGVKPHCNIMTTTEKSMGLAVINWPDTIQRVPQKTLLVNGLDVYTMGEPLLPDYIAKETVDMMKNATYEGVDGNHLTMLYGPGARQIAKYIKAFLPTNTMITNG